MLETWYKEIIASIVAAIVGSIIFVVRSVTTNTKKIALLEAEIRNRDRQQEMISRETQELKTDIRELRELIQRLFTSH